jgi:RNA polymerase sigma factor (sigma-70 family)
MEPEPVACPADVLHRQIWEGGADELRALEGQIVSAAGAAALSQAGVLGELPDETLALALQKGFLVRDVFTELFVVRYGPYLARWLFRWGTEGHQALDLVQQLYLKFYENRLASYRPEEHSFRAYLRQSAYHLWVQLVCRARKPEALSPYAEPPFLGPGPEQALLDQEAAARIDEALTQLRPLERGVLQATMDGQPAGDIARALGVRKEQVFMALYRGRRRMEQLLHLPGRPKPPRAAQVAPRAHEPRTSPGLFPKEPSGV